MKHAIFAKVEDCLVTFVGCVPEMEVPKDSIVLQVVEHHPEFQWVKWSVRFRRTLKDNKPLDHPYAHYFKNPSRLRVLLGDQQFEHVGSEENVRFLKFHEKNPQLLQECLDAALTKKADGRTEYSMDQLLGEARWGDTEIDRGTDRVKINGRWSAWYSRALQMMEPRLVGFFYVRSSIADGLVWIDGRRWQQFASEHANEIQWKDPFDELPDSDWEYRQ